MILDQMVGGIPQVHSAAVDFFLSAILICYGYLQIFELCHTFKRVITCVYVLLFCAACCSWNRNIFCAACCSWNRNIFCAACCSWNKCILCCMLFMEQKYILCCMLFMEQKYIFSFPIIHFQSSFLTVD